MAVNPLRALALLLIVLLAGALPVLAQQAGGRICVAAYHDANANGMRDPVEPLLADVVVTLQNDRAIVVDTYLTTGRSEPHCFEGLAPGFYLVGFSGGMAAPTGEQDFGVTLSGAEIVPLQVNYGAIPEAEQAQSPAMAPASTLLTGDNNVLLRIVFAAAGALLIMVFLAAVGLLIFWLRFRKA
ncbi:MAG: hypothetical protein HPY64_05640 [Anaerolineae bacterium]|nr:hypothetical protein [Anaerolineae bacterium]